VIRSILLDIEGTTTPISFVAETLFPYARARLARFLDEKRDDADVREDLARLRMEREREAEPGAPESPLPYLLWLMDRDRKSTALKSLQGKIWEDGYASGALVAPVYADVPRALRRWTAEGRDVSIYSSGSVLAQKLLFAHTDAGDLTPFLAAYFDTTIGPKRERESYARIASALARAPAEILFVSDVPAELEAARAAGLSVALAVRPGNPPMNAPAAWSVTSFDELPPRDGDRRS
jgi:enolase-phosphatase E1